MPYSTTEQNTLRTCSETTTTATTLPPGRVGRSRSDVLDTSNAHTSTGKSAESRLGTGAGRLGAVTTSGSDLDVESGDAEFCACQSMHILANTAQLTLAASGNVLGCQHGGVGRALVTVGLDLHTLLYSSVCVASSALDCTYTSDTGDGFAAGQIGDVHEGVVERSEDTGDTEDELTLYSRQFMLLFPQLSRRDAPRGPGVRAGCSPGERGRPSAWEAFWRYMRA